MKLVLCQINSQYIHASLASWSLAAAVRGDCRAPVVPVVEDANVNQPPAEVAARLAAARPDVLAFCCYIWNARYLTALLPLVRAALPGALLLAGGPEASFDAPQFLDAHPALDCLIAGEGERALPLLLDALTDGRLPKAAVLETLPGLVWRGDGAAKARQNPPAAPVTSLPDPYTPAYFAALAGRIAYIETARGCPFSCAFCLSGRDDGLRAFPLQEMERRLLLLANSGSRTIKFVDRTFNADERRALALWQFLAAARRDGRIPEGVCFHFEIGADLLSDAALAFLDTVPAGLFRFEAGLQSFNEKTLAAVQRRTDLARLCANLTRLRAAGRIHLHVDLIAGLPYEDAASFAVSFDRAFALAPHELQLGFLKLLRGSALRAQAQQLGIEYAPAPPYAVTRTRWLSPAELARLEHADRALGWLYNSGRYELTLAELLWHWQGGPLAFFAAFASVAAARGVTAGAPQDAVAEQLYLFGSALAGVSARRLRDLLAVDTLATRRGGRLPAFLHESDPDYGRVAFLLRGGAPGLAGLPVAGAVEKFFAGRLGFCLLSGGVGCCGGFRAVALADYTSRDPVTGRYAVETLPLTEFFALCGEQGGSPACPPALR